MHRHTRNISQMIRESWDQGEPAGWFEEVYAAAERGEAKIPWLAKRYNAELTEWLDREGIDGQGKTALVIGCGLGDDAEELARRGFAVTAFDIAPTAIARCKARFLQSTVDYQVADLFAAPAAWQAQFDFVLESHTLQALPYTITAQAIAIIAALCAPGGMVLVLAHGRDAEVPPHGIPWPLSRKELAAFEANGLREAQFEDHLTEGARRFRVTYLKNGA